MGGCNKDDEMSPLKQNLVTAYVFIFQMIPRFTIRCIVPHRALNAATIWLQITIQIWARGILKETSKSTQIKSSHPPYILHLMGHLKKGKGLDC